MSECEETGPLRSSFDDGIIHVPWNIQLSAHFSRSLATRKT